MSGIKNLAEATQAETKGCEVGSKSFEFHPRTGPQGMTTRNIRIKADSAASVLLVFQAILPFLLFAGDEKDSPITATIQGGTNVSFSLSYEYLDQVLLPSLERFGIKIERKLEYRGWSHGSKSVGSIKFGITPLSPGKSLQPPDWPTEQGKITKIDMSIIVPKEMMESLKNSLLFELNLVFPDAETNLVLIEDSRHPARVYTLLVAHTSTGLRFGRDWLYDKTTKNKTAAKISTEMAQKVVDDLDTEIRKGGVVDEFLQDQLIVFQTLATGASSIPYTADALTSDRHRVDRTDEPFGDGSTHTSTARWVASQFLPQVRWVDKGRICEGAGWKTMS
jgi:RNA 3'-terminal phosphate cyclase (ATP)